MGAFTPQRADLIEKVQTRWLWKPYIPRGQISLLTGEPGCGKSTIVCDLAAALSTGRPLFGEPDDFKRPIMRTWIMNAEDSPSETIVWRLDNQKADRSQIWLTEHGPPITEKNAPDITKVIKEHSIDFLVADPLQAWMAAAVDMHRANEVRQWGAVLRDICSGTGVTILLCRHRRKGTEEDHKHMNSGLGSIDFTGIARSEMGVIVRARENTFSIDRVKGNVGKKPEELVYARDEHSDPANEHGILRWVGWRAKGKNGTLDQRSAAKDWLLTLLANGPVPSKEAIDQGAQNGHNERTLQRARKDVGRAYQDHNGTWMWELKADG